MNISNSADIKLGNTNITSIFLGSLNVWDSTSPVLPDGWSIIGENTLEYFAGNNLRVSGNGLVLMASAHLTSPKVYELDNQFSERSGLDISYYNSLELNESGSFIVVGSFQNGVDNKGTIRVLEWTGTSWQQRGQSIQGIDGLAQAGKSVAISANGQTIAFTEGSYAGWQYVRVFDFNLLEWVERPNLQSRLGVEFNQVQLDATGSVIVLASKNGTEENGEIVTSIKAEGFVEVFEFSNGQWSQLGAKIFGYNDSSDRGNEISFEGIHAPGGEESGYSISLSPAGNVLVIGAPLNVAEGIYFVPPDFVGWRAAGKARVYEYNGTDWVQKGADLIAPNSREKNDNGSFKKWGFGGKVAIDSTGEKVIVRHAQTRADGFNGTPAFVLYEFIDGSWTYAGNFPDGNDFGASHDFSRVVTGYRFKIKVAGI